jgi:hypothetical protein
MIGLKEACHMISRRQAGRLTLLEALKRSMREVKRGRKAKAKKAEKRLRHAFITV